MTLAGGRVAVSAARAESADVAIRSGRICGFGRGDGVVVDVSGHVILPGLINAHDHLEFSLFPRLGRGPYPNAAAWAEDIYRPEESPVKEHLSVPKPVRLVWGGIKNLLSGVTTVAHHNPYEAAVFGRSFPVRVVRRFGWAHSLHFSPDVGERFRATRAGWPFIIHAAEGTDSAARDEGFRLDKMGALTRRTVLVHATGLDADGLDLVRKRGASIIWCPSSNLFTLGRTLGEDVLRSGVPIALGTDSSLTSAGALREELCTAAGVALEEVYAMVTERAARILRLNHGEGALREGGAADLVAVADRDGSPAEALHSICPELVIAGGRIQLASVRFAERLPGPLKAHLNPIQLDGCRWLIAADTKRLVETTSGLLGPDFRLGGRRVSL